MTGSGQSNVVLGGVSVRLAPAVLTVKADDQTRAYGATNGPLTVTYSGFLDGEDAGVLSGSPALSTDAETNSPVGTYPITVSVGTLSNAHYSFSFTNGTLTVTQAVLTVKADDQVRGLWSDQCAADGQLQRVRKWAGHQHPERRPVTEHGGGDQQSRGRISDHGGSGDIERGRYQLQPRFC